MLPVLRLLSAEMQRRVPTLRVEYAIAGAQSRQGAPALIWELQGGPVTCGGFPVGDRRSRTLAIRSVVVVAELRARDNRQGMEGGDLEAAEELLQQLTRSLDKVCPADYDLAEDWRANQAQGASAASCAVCRAAVTLRVKLQADPWGSVTVQDTSAAGELTS